MKKFYLFLFSLTFLSVLHAQVPFVVTYGFNNDYTAIVEKGEEAVGIKNAEVGGDRLLASKFVTDGASTAWEGEILTNVTTFKSTFIRMNIQPKASYRLVVDSIVSRQKMNNTGGAYNFRVGCTVSGTLPVENESCTSPQAFKSTYSNYTYTPSASHATAQGMDYISTWISARCLLSGSSLWTVDEVKIYGTYVKIIESIPDIIVSSDKKQIMRYGVDLAALWYFHSNKKEQLAQLAVGDMKPEFVRIAFANNYQKEKNVYDESAYMQILEAMEAMRNANNDILYFGSPGALHTVYTDVEK
ncbi:MAG: hypothetical protein ACK5MK_04600, partial [Dysgonomonas sp.]